MQAVEFAQNGRRRRTRLRFVEAGDQHFDTGAENEGLLMVQWGLGAGHQQKYQGGQKY
jgi:hypothetical protein